MNLFDEYEHYKLSINGEYLRKILGGTVKQIEIQDRIKRKLR